MTYDRTALYETVVACLLKEPRAAAGDIAARLRVSRRTLQETMLESTGIGFRELQKKMLVARVCMLLRERPLSVKELSFAVGYKSPRSFARAIKRVCGAAPRDLRAYMDSLVPKVGEVTGAPLPEPATDDAEPDGGEGGVSVRMTRSQMDLLQLYCEFSGASENDVITSAVRRTCELHGEFWSWVLQRRMRDGGDS
jgi:AraC-like DNA-binding protein